MKTMHDTLEAFGDVDNYVEPFAGSAAMHCASVNRDVSRMKSPMWCG